MRFAKSELQPFWVLLPMKIQMAVLEEQNEVYHSRVLYGHVTHTSLHRKPEFLESRILPITLRCRYFGCPTEMLFHPPTNLNVLHLDLSFPIP
jgi:hypothetical protein